MTIANKLTFFRVLLAPVFFAIYVLPQKAVWTVPVLILIFTVSQVTDLLDGLAARKRNEISDFGKFFDPFADTITQITCFLCFVLDNIWGAGIFPAILFLIVIYREFSVLLIRNLMLKKGITLGASMGGKIKTVSYIVAGGSALLVMSLKRLDIDIFNFLIPYVRIGALVIFVISVIFSVITFFNYLSTYLKTLKKDQA
jgi:CDP-diacylglycerol--glycerol-3-phosphate 3-phosphatidyltransferase